MGSLDTVQQEQLRAIGTYLSQIRQEQERSLEDIAAKTYIPLRLLKAIEAGQERPLPEPVFIQGFIRRYADALGLDGVDLSQKFPVHVTPLPVAPVPASGRELRLNNASESNYVRSQLEDEFPRQPRASQRTTDFLPYIAAAALLGLGGIALGVVRAISSRQPDPPTRSAVVLPKQPSVSGSPEAATPSPTVPSSPTAGSSPTRAASPSSTATSSPATSSTRASASSSPLASTTTSNAPVSVKLNLTDESWVQVVVDGEVKAEAVLPGGTQQSWSGQRQIIVLAGNAGAVSVSHNGGAAQKMGALGDVSERTFAPKPSGASSSSSPSAN